MRKKTDLSPTAFGALAGSAVGASLGLILGSTGGNAGEGFAVGALGGAALGAAVGHQMDKGDNKGIEEEDAVDRSLKKAANNQSSSNTKQARNKSKTKYNISSKNSSSATKKTSIASKSKKSNEEKLAKSETGKTSRARMTSQKAEQKPASKIEIPASVTKTESVKVESAIEEKVNESQEVLSSNAEVAKTNEVVEQSVVQAVSDSGLPPAAKNVEQSDGVRINNSASETLETSQISGAEDKTVESKRAASLDPACAEAASEAKRANSAGSEADKLFYLRRALRLCPSQASYHIAAGRVYANIGRSRDAKISFQKALELDPENQEAQQELSVQQLRGSN